MGDETFRAFERNCPRAGFGRLQGSGDMRAGLDVFCPIGARWEIKHRFLRRISGGSIFGQTIPSANSRNEPSKDRRSWPEIV